MVSTSKILTVSYGTFSCTLEGFDDSFETMKAIAEYFRDLSAGDRYFGAEPATPDADMLARIAEREISRHVEAQDADGKIHLRAGPAALPAMSRLAEAGPSRRPASDSAAPAASFDPPPTAQPSPRAAHSSSESMADKLRRIRAVAGPSGSAFSASGYDEDEDAQTEDFLPDAAPPLAAAPAEDGAPTARATPDQQPDAPAEADVAPQAVDEDTADAPPEADEGTAQPETAERETAEPETEALSAESRNTDFDADPEPAAALYTADDDILSRLGDFADDMAPDEAPAEPSQDASALAALDRLQDDDEDDDDVAPIGQSQESADPLAQLLADTLQGGAMTAAETDAAEDFVEDDTAEDDTAEDDTAEDDTAKETDAEDAVSGEQQARPLDARVIKMKRADLDAALAGGSFDEEMAEHADGGALSAEAEADLQRELAEVEAELNMFRAPEALIPHPGHASQDEDEDEADDALAAFADDDDDDDDDEELFSDVQDEESDARRARRHEQSAPDLQASRIFDEAATQLDEPESNQRRSAIQHLRAAVAATKAERRAGGAMSPGVDDQPYRKDLQSAVRPRRPQPAGAATPRPAALSAGRPAPLKLVAEQRIDTPAAPVRPRRITRADLVGAPARSAPSAASGQSAEGPDFADYAEQMGASSLTDLLEAAAAYMADIEGTPQFSRPMLMEKLREAHEDDFTREEGLRSFGQLLRQGKLQKLKGGRFAVTDVTDFRQSA